MLTIVLKQLEFEGRHGATALERRTTRKFQLDVEIDLAACGAETSDRLQDTIDYSSVAEMLVAIGTGEPRRMLEALGRNMMNALRDRLPQARKIRLELRKLNPPSCPGHPAYAAVRFDE